MPSKTFDPKFIAQWEKAISVTGASATATWALTGPSLWMMTTEWKDEHSHTVGRLEGTFNTFTGAGTITNLILDPAFQNKGIYAACVEAATRLFPERGITKLVATPLDSLASAILQTGGFTPPAHDLDAFNVHLDSDRMKEYLLFRETGQEPDWRKEASRQAQRLANPRNND